MARKVLVGVPGGMSPRMKVPSQIKAKEKMGESATALFDKVALEVMHGHRAIFDGLSLHEQKQVIEWLSDALVDGNADNMIHDVLWEVDFLRKPVDIGTFLTNPDYLGKSCAELHENWLRDLHNVFRLGSPVAEWIATGCIGSGKTTCAAAGVAYKLYYLSCMRDPARYYGLLSGSKIVFGVYSVTKVQAADSAFYKMMAYLDTSPYFLNVFKRNMKKNSRIEFLSSPMEVVPGSRELHAIGLDLFACIIDEANFMKVSTEKESQEVTGQAYDLYNSTVSRLTSRFSRPGGTLPGISVIMSSRFAATSFLEERISKTKGNPTAYVSDYALWEVKPKARFATIWGLKSSAADTPPAFDVEVGDRVARSRILRKDETPRTGARVVKIPGELRNRFEEDVDQSLRDFAGVATFNAAPLISDRQSVFDAVRTNLVHPFKRDSITLDYQDTMMIQDYFDTEAACKVVGSKWVPILNPGCPRFLHVDIALSGDSAGVGMSHMSGFKQVRKEYPDGNVGTIEMPFILVDFMLQILPPQGSQIDLSKIRSFMLYLREFYNIETVTYDGYQSADSIQLLRKAGMMVSLESVDRTEEPYMVLRNAFYERRIGMYGYQVFQDEVLDLQRDLKKHKVDHPQKASRGGKGCFAGSTKVSLLDGREVSLAELAETPDQPIYVYTIKDGAVTLGSAVNPRLTQCKARTVVVTLDNGEKITCTPDHRFMLRSGLYREARDLSAGDSLMPLYRKVSNRDGLKGYECYQCPGDGRWHFTHRMVGREKYGSRYTGNQYGEGIIHHQRGKRNNDPRFLDLVSQSEHARMHADDLKRRRSDPVFESKRRRNALRYARSQKGRGLSKLNMQQLNERPGFKDALRLRSSIIGKKTGRSNITKYNKSATHREVAFRIGKVTIWKAIEARCRSDVTISKILTLLESPGATQRSVASALNCSLRLVEVRLSKFRNHKVVSVSPGPLCDVYDLSVPGTENFALSAGVFVHNSKDVADGVCGSVWSCINSPTAMKAAPPLGQEGPLLLTRLVDPGGGNKPVLAQSTSGAPVLAPANMQTVRRINGVPTDWGDLAKNL